MGTIQLGLCQMKVTADKAENLRTAEEAIRTAARQGAELVLLPEMFNCPYENACFPVYAEPAGGETWQFLSRIAKENAVERPRRSAFSKSVFKSPVNMPDSSYNTLKASGENSPFSVSFSATGTFFSAGTPTVSTNAFCSHNGLSAETEGEKSIPASRATAIFSGVALSGTCANGERAKKASAAFKTKASCVCSRKISANRNASSSLPFKASHISRIFSVFSAGYAHAL